MVLGERARGAVGAEQAEGRERAVGTRAAREVVGRVEVLVLPAYVAGNEASVGPRGSQRRRRDFFSRRGFALWQKVHEAEPRPEK